MSISESMFSNYANNVYQIYDREIMMVVYKTIVLRCILDFDKVT